ncbi:MAG: hypothetical protein P8J52_05380 [Gammaproteobacteria bacterium]|jgi:hypothetical protein|nr:hypothetical protein [Gammaproteobacteria bacterium]
MRIANLYSLLIPIVFFSSTLIAQRVIPGETRYLDLATNSINDRCLSYGGNDYQVGFELQNTLGVFSLYVTSATQLNSLDTIPPLSSNYNFKDCSLLSVDWQNKVYYNIYDLTIVEGAIDKQTPYDIRATADLTNLSQGFEVLSACPSSSSNAEYRRCMKLNIPNLNPEHYLLFSDSSAIPSDLYEDYRQILDWLIEMGLGYDRFVHITYELEGDNKKALGTLKELGLVTKNIKREPVNNIDEVHDQRGCLHGFASYGEVLHGKKNYSGCIQPNPYTNPSSMFVDWRATAGAGFRYHVAHSWLHEYFHHTQTVHALEKEMSTKADSGCTGFGCDHVEAPPFWVEGAAIVFPDMFLWEKFYQLNHTKRNGFKRGSKGAWHRQADSPVVCQGHTFYLCDQGFALFSGERKRIQDAGGKCYLGARDSTGIFDGVKRETQCGWAMAAYYLAYYTSHQVLFVDIPRDMWAMGFPAAFEKHVGMDIDQFAENYSSFITAGSANDPPPVGFFSEKPLSELVDFWSLKENPSGY